MFDKVKEGFETLKAWYLRNKARRSLISRYEYLLQNNSLLEDFDTYRILEFQENQRNKDLSKIQQENEQIMIMLEYLKNIKKIKNRKKSF